MPGKSSLSGWNPARTSADRIDRTQGRPERRCSRWGWRLMTKQKEFMRAQDISEKQIEALARCEASSFFDAIDSCCTNNETRTLDQAQKRQLLSTLASPMDNSVDPGTWRGISTATERRLDRSCDSVMRARCRWAPKLLDKTLDYSKAGSEDLARQLLAESIKQRGVRSRQSQQLPINGFRLRTRPSRKELDDAVRIQGRVTLLNQDINSNPQTSHISFDRYYGEATGRTFFMWLKPDHKSFGYFCPSALWFGYSPGQATYEMHLCPFGELTDAPPDESTT